MTKFIAVFQDDQPEAHPDYKILEAASGREALDMARQHWLNHYDGGSMLHVYVGALMYADPQDKWLKGTQKEQEKERTREEQELISQEIGAVKKLQEKYGYSTPKKQMR